MSTSTTRIAARLRVPNRHTTNKQKKAYKKILIEQLVKVFAGLLEDDETMYRITEKCTSDGKYQEKELSMLVILQNNKPIPGGMEINQKLDRILTNQRVLAELIEQNKETP